MYAPVSVVCILFLCVLFLLLVCWRCHFNIVEFRGNQIFMLKYPFKQLCQFSIEIAFGNLRCVSWWLFSITLLLRANWILIVSKSNILRFILPQQISAKKPLWNLVKWWSLFFYKHTKSYIRYSNTCHRFQNVSNSTRYFHSTLGRLT